jgi:hypothetical protein
MDRLIINQNEKTMKSIYLAIAIFCLSAMASAHNGEDPAAEVVKKRSYVLKYQKEYQTATSQEERIRNIKKQVSTLQSTNLLLRNSLVKESRAVRADLSKYNLDYLAAIKNSLKDMRKLLKQLEAAVES